MVTYYCTSCWHSGMSDKHRCPVCGSVGKFCTEQEYGERMIGHLNHKFRDYRIDALQKIREIRFEPAIPAIQEMVAHGKDPIILHEAKRTLTEIISYQEHQKRDDMLDRASSTNVGLDFYTPQIGLIDISGISTSRDHHKLRSSSSPGRTG